jgi:hypothetical protein
VLRSPAHLGLAGTLEARPPRRPSEGSTSGGFSPRHPLLRRQTRTSGERVTVRAANSAIAVGRSGADTGWLPGRRPDHEAATPPTQPSPTTTSHHCAALAREPC